MGRGLHLDGEVAVEVGYHAVLRALLHYGGTHYGLTHTVLNVTLHCLRLDCRTKE